VSALGVSDGSTGGLNSFGWTVLAIHFMQLRHQHCFLPIPEYRLHSVHSVQSNSFLSLCNMDCTPLLAPLSQFFDFVAHEFPFKTGSASIIG
jgi:DNA polymerase sigma